MQLFSRPYKISGKKKRQDCAATRHSLINLGLLFASWRMQDKISNLLLQI
jgi:hypothetical protein